MFLSSLHPWLCQCTLHLEVDSWLLNSFPPVIWKDSAFSWVEETTRQALLFSFSPCQMLPSRTEGAEPLESCLGSRGGGEGAVHRVAQQGLKKLKVNKSKDDNKKLSL